MNVLLTGANGFLGNIILDSLKQEYTIKKLSRNSGDYKFSLDNEVPYFTEVFDLIIHSAGKAHSVPKTEEEKRQFQEVNVIGTINLLKGIETAGIPKQFVFISSVAVYGQEFGKAIDENFLLQAKDPYGKSKIEAEELVIEWCKKHDVVCTILRLPLLIGKNPPGNLGAMLKAIDKGYYFNIAGGKAKKSMVVAEDVAFFIPKAAAVGGIFNLTDGVHPNFKELSIVLSRQKNKKEPLNLPLLVIKPIGTVGDLIGEKAPINSLKIKKITSDLTFDDSKAREFLGWKPRSVLKYLEDNNL